MRALMGIRLFDGTVAPSRDAPFVAVAFGRKDVELLGKEKGATAAIPESAHIGIVGFAAIVLGTMARRVAARAIQAFEAAKPAFAGHLLADGLMPCMSGLFTRALIRAGALPRGSACVSLGCSAGLGTAGAVAEGLAPGVSAAASSHGSGFPFSRELRLKMRRNPTRRTR